MSAEDSKPQPKKRSSSRKRRDEGLFEKVAAVLATPFAFLGRWFATRSYGRFGLALPAFVAAGAALGFALESRHQSASTLVVEYSAAAAVASRNADWERAELFLQKAVLLGPGDPELLFRLALVSEEQANHARCRALMLRLATLDNKGYVPAHLWIVRDLLRQRPAPAPQDVELAKEHLQNALRREAENLDALTILGHLFVAQGKPQAALPLFKKAAIQKPELGLLVAQLQLQTGETALGKRGAELTADHFRAQAEADPKNDGYRIAWAECYRLQERFDKALEILQASPNPESVALRQARAAVYISWYDKVTQTGPEALTRRLELLQQALAHAPDSPLVLNRLAMLATEENSEEAQKELSAVLARGAAPATVHFIIGTSALVKGSEEQALRHLELAFSQEPRMAIAANNLAWALAHGAKPNLERAHSLADAAIKLAPQHPEIRETRGVILAKLKQPKPAIADLEFALRAFPDRASLHELLGTLYDEIGDQDLAATHRKLATEASPPKK